MRPARSIGMLAVAAAIAVGVGACSSDSSGSDSSGASSTPASDTSVGSTTTAAGATTPPGESTTTTAGTPASETTVAGETTATTATTVTTETTSPTVATLPPIKPTSDTPPDPSELALVEIAEVSNPVDLTFRAGDDALYIVSADGFVVALRDGVLDETTLLDISGDITSGGEQGLLGLTFSTDGAYAYVDYTNQDGDTEITEYAVDDSGVFDPASKRVLLEIDQPYGNHNGGQVRIGPDGYLYIGMGDGGSGGDPERRALDVGTLLGKMLRIDPTPGDGTEYSIPADNPFASVDGALPEIFAVGLRNPWRFSFDRVTNDLWIADVGQGSIEEVDVAWADQGGGNGLNFGWSAFEGSQRFNDDQPEGGVTMPIHEYTHDTGDCSISGGVRYRGEAIPALYGWYVFADFCGNEVRAFPVLDNRTAGEAVVLATGLNGVSEVAQGPDGELYVVALGSGTVYTLQPAS